MKEASSDGSEYSKIVDSDKWGRLVLMFNNTGEGNAVRGNKFGFYEQAATI